MTNAVMADGNVAWLFPGQGAQQVGMGHDLYDGSAAARTVFQSANDDLGYSLSDLCFNGPEDELQQTKHAQPAIFVASIACLAAAREMDSHSIASPSYIAGHSLGEFTALVAAEALDFSDALRLVAERGRLMQQAAEAQPGAMAALLGLDEDAVSVICKETGTELCNVNAPGQIVIGGTPHAIEEAMRVAKERGARRSVRLNVSGAFHTTHMASAADELAKAVAESPLRDPSVPIIANSTAEPLTTAEGLREELVRQLTRPVRWQASMEYLRGAHVTAVIEFGPGRVLTGLARRIDRSFAVRNVSGLASARSQQATATPP